MITQAAPKKVVLLNSNINYCIKEQLFASEHHQHEQALLSAILADTRLSFCITTLPLPPI